MSDRISLANLTWVAILFVLVVSHAAAADPKTLDFSNLSALQPVAPYEEDGFTVSVLSPGNGAGVCEGRRGDGYLCGSTIETPVRFRIYGETPFDLVSLDVESVFRDWRIESPSGAIVALTSSEFHYATPGTIDFAALDGWRSIDYFEIVHDPGQSSANLNIDNIHLLPVPEPATLALATALAAIATNLRPRRSQRVPLLTC